MSGSGVGRIKGGGNIAGGMRAAKQIWPAAGPRPISPSDLQDGRQGDAPRRRFSKQNSVTATPSSANSARAAWRGSGSRPTSGTSATVALKVLRPELALSGVADRFLREVRVLADLQHPHILALLDSGLVPLTPGGEQICPYLRHAARARRVPARAPDARGTAPARDRQRHRVAGRRRRSTMRTSAAWCIAT